MASKRVVTVIGATGNQGGSVVDYLQAYDTGDYVVRAVTRNPDTEAAKDLVTRGVQVVQADLDDVLSLTKAFKGSYAIFAVTDFWTLAEHLGVEEAAARETRQGRNLADAAEATRESLGHYIWSTLVDTARVSDGHFVVPHYESKAAVARYIECKPELCSRTTFLWCSYYAGNLTRDYLRPVFIPSAGKYVQMQAVPEDTPMAFMGDTRANLGAFAVAILEQPQMTRGGKVVFAYIEKTTLGGILQSWARAHGVKAQYVQIPSESYFRLFQGQVEEMHVGMGFWDYARNKSWAPKQGLLTYHDLGIDTSRLMSVEASFGQLPLQ